MESFSKKMPSEEAYELLPQQIFDGDLSLQDPRGQEILTHDQASIAVSTMPLVHDPVDSDKRPVVEAYPSHFSRRKQFRKLLFKGFLRFLLTIFIMTCIQLTLWAYGRRDIIGPVGKRVFNALITGLSMILGISIASSFKAIAIDMRWWILSRRRRPIHEVDAILACYSLTELAKLAKKSVRHKKPGIVLACAGWILLNIAAQAGVAMLGLTYQLNNKSDPTKPVPGMTMFSNMTSSFGTAIDEDTTASSQLSAHTYGEMALQFSSWPVDDESIFAAYVSPFNAPLYFEGPGYFEMFFQERSAPLDDTGYFWSNRSITTTSNCIVYTVHNNTNGASETFQYEKGGQLQTATWHSIGPNSTTYLTSPNNITCGPRCAEVQVFENNGTAAYYYECTVNVSTVHNATVLPQQVPDSNARLAAGAIALQGYQSDNTAKQYQQFPAGSTYGNWAAGSDALVALYLRQYAIGVFLTADQIFPQINYTALPVLGLLPQQGLTLSIDHHSYIWAIFGSIAGAHLLLWLIGAYIASRVIVVEDSYLKIALLLRPVTDDLEQQGLLMGGHKHEHGALDANVVYGPRDEADGVEVRALEISSVANCEQASKRWEGSYNS